MKVELKANGKLIIRAENEVEAYALRKWRRGMTDVALLERIVVVCSFPVVGIDFSVPDSQVKNRIYHPPECILVEVGREKRICFQCRHATVGPKKHTVVNRDNKKYVIWECGHCGLWKEE